jgi:hypothetical protein
MSVTSVWLYVQASPNLYLLTKNHLHKASMYCRLLQLPAETNDYDILLNDRLQSTLLDSYALGDGKKTLWSMPGMKDLFDRLKIRLLGFEENKQMIEKVGCFVQEQLHIIIL